LTDGHSHGADRPTPIPAGSSGVTQLKWHSRLSGSRLGRYRLGARLGLGGAASVYLARLDGPHEFERVLAVKIIHEHLSEESEFVSMFLDEANLAVRLQHPNVIHVYELGQEGETLFLAMEYLHGQPLSVLLRTLADRGMRLPFEVIAWMGAQAAEGLAHAHQLTDDAGEPVGLVHRDISPDNIFVTYDGHIKLIDFGIARARGRATTTELGTIKGKYCYMAPELALGRDFDHRVDLFALGATLYEAALGQPLFAGADDADTLGNILSGPVADPRTVIPGFPAALAPILLRALETEPEDRTPDAATMAKHLAAVPKEPAAVLREQLAELMKELFLQQRAAEAKAIAALKQLRTMPPPAPAEAPAEESATGAPARSGGRVAVLAAVPLLIVAAILGGWLVVRGNPNLPPPAVSAAVPAPDTSVTIDVRSQPPVDATITIGGRLVETRPARLRVARSSEVVPIVVEAEGYDPARLEVVPERDQFLVIPLTRMAPSASAAAATSASAAAAVSVALPAGTDRSLPAARATASRPGVPIRPGAGSGRSVSDLKKPPDW